MTRVPARALTVSLLAAVTTIATGAPPSLSETVTDSDSQGVSLTIYNQNFGLVKDVRSVDLKDGVNYLRFEDVAAMIDPTSVSFESLTAPNAVAVREQNYQYDLMDPNTILSKSVGKNVKFKQYLPGGQIVELSGVLLNPPVATVSDTEGHVSTRHQGLVLKTGEGIVLNPSGQAELAELPAGLVSRPSLLWKLESTKAGKHQTEIGYQTAGLNWRCDYVAVSSPDDSQADLTSWVTLDNKSGATYKNASLKLLAGDVHRVQPPVRPMMKQALGAVAAPAPQFKEQAFAEYHLYTLKGKTDVNQNETKQLSLFNANNVPTKKLFMFEPEAPIVYGYWREGDNQKVKVKLEIENSEANHLGMPLPKGKVRVYKRDQDGALQFIGEDMIDHTPRDEKVRLYIGDAFDLVGERKQTNYQRVSDHVQRMSYEISLRNHKDSAVTITAVEHSYGQWKILESSHPYTKKDARTFEFSVKVPARGEVKITYDIEVRS
jgi:hypothetical protein